MRFIDSLRRFWTIKVLFCFLFILNPRLFILASLISSTFNNVEQRLHFRQIVVARIIFFIRSLNLETDVSFFVAICNSCIRVFELERGEDTNLQRNPSLGKANHSKFKISSMWRHWIFVILPNSIYTLILWPFYKIVSVFMFILLVLCAQESIIIYSVISWDFHFWKQKLGCSLDGNTIHDSVFYYGTQSNSGELYLLLFDRRKHVLEKRFLCGAISRGFWKSGRCRSSLGLALTKCRQCRGLIGSFSVRALLIKCISAFPILVAIYR